MKAEVFILGESRMDCTWVLFSCFLLLNSIGLQAQVTVLDKLTGFIGQEVLLPCTFQSKDPNIRVSQIQWMKDGRSVAIYSPQHGNYVTDSNFQLPDPSQRSATLRIMQVNAKDEGDYTCEATVFPDGIHRAVSSLTVKSLLAQVNVQEKVTGLIGQEVILPCTFRSRDPNIRVSQIMWLKEGRSIAVYSPQHGTYVEDSNFQLLQPSQKSATLRIIQVHAKDGGDYTCQVTVYSDGIHSAVSTLTVKVLGLQTQVDVQDKLTGFIGQEVLLPCTIHSNDLNIRVSQISWIKDGQNIAVYSPQHGTHVMDFNFKFLQPSQKNGTLSIMQVRTKDEGNYTCEVTLFPGVILRGVSSFIVKENADNCRILEKLKTYEEDIQDLMEAVKGLQTSIKELRADFAHFKNSLPVNELQVIINELRADIANFTKNAN
ncbi:nectin-2-like isoform X2 [Hyperolius riggenbachi]|uniref:nectin-2-like isoform X2 n=1 Tax=Hyperolius riggenbachi TaxID=752182 RepID=UPI0035A2C6EF